MSRIRSRNTKPELRVRKLAHRLGLRFRLHRSDLPGTPDLVFPKYNTALFVHGCFWHRHAGCSYSTTPTTRAQYWADKFKKNVERDKKVQRALRAKGWKVEVIWECQTRSSTEATNRLKAMFGLS